MTNKRRYRWLALVAAIAAGACSHTPDAGDIPAGVVFTARILADGTKLFTYGQRFMRGDLEAMDYAAFDGSKSQREREAARMAAPKAARRGLAALLAQNQYCRDEYMVLEQYEQHGSYIIRGECRDAATSADREKYSQ